MRAFDPALLEQVDDCTLEDDDLTFVEQCPICGEDLVFEPVLETLVNLDGEVHYCPET